MTTSPALQVVDVTKRFGSFVALQDVSLTVQRRTLHAVIGPNGAGKTTLFNVLTGQLRPSSGHVVVDGQRLGAVPVHRRVGLGIARSFQVTSLFQELTAHENVRLAAQGMRARSALAFWSRTKPDSEFDDRAEQLLARVGLAQLGRRRAGELSHGQQRLLEVAMALGPDPDVLLLDEPTSGMGADDVPAMSELLAELTGRYTLVVIEHNMAMIMRIAGRIAVLMSGRLLLDDEPAAIRAHPEVQRAYLGRDVDAVAD